MTSTTPAADSAVPVKRRRDRAAREREILDEAERIFGERGYQGTSMDEIAAAVGVSKPLVYQYYGSKDGLFLACLSRLRAQLLDAVSDAVLGASDPEDAMYSGFVAWFTFLDEHPRAWSVIVDEGMLSAGPAAQAADEVRADFVELIATMVRLNLPHGSGDRRGADPDRRPVHLRRHRTPRHLANPERRHPLPHEDRRDPAGTPLARPRRPPRLTRPDPHPINRRPAGDCPRSTRRSPPADPWRLMGWASAVHPPGLARRHRNGVI